MSKAKNTKLWGGRFDAKTLSEVDSFNASVSFDYKLWRYDIQGSIAHAKMLARQKIISAEDFRLIQKGLKAIHADIEAGKFEWKLENEDVHLNIEAELTARIGPVGGKLHTARSRNDQVALDLRLYARDQVKELRQAIRQFQEVLVSRAEEHQNTILPGYTHLQRAQPILLAHHLLAYFEMLERDDERLAEVLKRIETLPLGSGALAGTTFPIDRKFVAEELGFKRVSANSLDAVSDRDFVVELLSISALIQMHLSRLAEEFILWSTFEFDFVALPEGFCTGSSMMPQKMNPDVLELIRGKTGRVFGNLTGLLATLKGLPLAYNKDLQEDKEPLFDSLETTLACLKLIAPLIGGTRFKTDNLLAATEQGYLVATDLADYLVLKGIVFREAHHITGKIVRYCQDHRAVIETLPLEVLQKFSEKITEDVRDWISVERSVARRKSEGGTAKTEVKKQIAKARRLLKSKR